MTLNALSTSNIHNRSKKDGFALRGNNRGKGQSPGHIFFSETVTALLNRFLSIHVRLRYVRVTLAYVRLG